MKPVRLSSIRLFRVNGHAQCIVSKRKTNIPVEDVQCIGTQRITVSNAFFHEQKYHQTGSYVVRLYRAAFGNNQPISNNDNNPNFPNENKV